MRMLKPYQVRQVSYIVGAVLFGALVYLVFGETLGDASAIVSILPVALTASFFGYRAGLVATTLAFPFNTFVLDFLSGVRNEEGVITTTRALITFSLVIVSWVFGRFHTLRVELDEFRNAERDTDDQLRRSEQRLREFLSATPDAILRVGQQGRLIELYGERNFGLEGPKQDFLYRDLREILPRHASEALLAGVGAAIETGEDQVVRSEVNFGKGKRVMEVSISPAGREAVAIARDVTDQVAAEDQQIEVEVSRTRESFVTRVAHELRTPLAGIVGFSNELRDQHTSFTPQERAEVIDIIAGQAAHLTRRVDDLIVATRASDDQLTIEPTRVDMLAITQAEVERLGVDVRVIGEPVFAVADARRAGHAIRNLIDNARQHGGDDVFVKVRANDREVLVEVCDDGPGINSDIETMFTAYQTAAEAETQPDRLGLGLVVARQLARLMEGDVTYKRKSGLSSFTLELPVAA